MENWYNILRQKDNKILNMEMTNFQTQAENLSFPYLKSYCPLNFRKSHQVSWFCCIPNGGYKEDNLKEGRICPPPPPIRNRVKFIEENDGV